jgi:hypothetical protein
MAERRIEAGNGFLSPGTDVIILTIFSQKKSAKKLAFLTTKLIFAKF